MGGWGIIAADIIVMASLSQIAGRYFLELVGVHAAGTGWVTAAGVVVMVITARFLPRYFADGITAPAKTEGSSL